MRRLLFQLLTLLALPLLTSCATYEWYYEPAMSEIRTDLPLGSSLGRVDYYLTQHQVEHAYYRHSNQIVAHIRNVRRDALVQAELSVIFQFDANERLADIREKPAYTAP